MVYESGKQYKFTYTGEVSSNALVMGSGQLSNMVIAAEVIITANTPCDLKLQVVLEDVVGADTQEGEAAWFIEALQAYDLHFSYQEGKVEYLCSHVEEDPVVTNFKRGILSALQVSTPDLTPDTLLVLDEEDVSGWCQTVYEVTSDTQITKTKEDGALETVECSEEIEVMTSLASYLSPNNTNTNTTNANTPSSAMATVKTTSVLQRTSVEDFSDDTFVKEGQIWQRSSLSADLKGASESARKRKPKEQNIKAQIETTLASLLVSLDSESGQDEHRPHLFTHLVHLLTQMDKEQARELEAIWDANTDSTDSRNFLVDGLMLCESSVCVQFLSDLTLDQETIGTTITLTPQRITSWLTALHFHHTPQPESVQAVMELGDNIVELSGQTMMAASTMIHKICHRDPILCHTVSEPFTKYVREEVKEWCEGKESQHHPTTRTHRHHNFIQVLRALGNAGIGPDDAFPQNCYMNSTLKPEVRVAALQSYRRVGCPVSQAPWKILEDGGETGEVRMAAYRALVPCAPSMPQFFPKLKHLLEYEEDNQVGSYIWSHVDSMIEEPGPSDYEQTMAQLARHYLLPLRFSAPVEDFRTSRNHRFSRFSQLMNLGGSVDTDMIFTPASFLPKRVSANVTLNLLDVSFNALEFGGEFSGVEKLLERLFGKEGYFGNQHLLNLVTPDGDEPDTSEDDEANGGGGRSERNIIQEDKIQEFQKLYDQGRAGSQTPEEEEEETKASMYMRVFGNEVFYLDNLLPLNPQDLLSNLLQALSTSKSFQLVDQEYMRVTQLGYPLHLRLNASGSVIFKHDFNIKRTDGGGMSLEGNVAPSMVIAADERLWVDGYMAASGVQRTSTLTAHTQFGGKISLNQGSLAEAQINVPNSEVTKMSLSTKVAMYDNSKKAWKQQADPLPQDTIESCTSEPFNQALGLKLCASVASGTPEVAGETVARGSYKSSLAITKTDSFNHYRLYAARNLNQANVLEVLFDTPGSTTDRKVNLIFNMRPNNAGGYIVLRSIGYGLKGTFENTDELKELTFEYLQASKVVGKFGVSLKKEVEGSETHLTPSLVVTWSQIHTVWVESCPMVSRTEKDYMKVEDGREMTQAFGLATGEFVAGKEKGKLNATAEYGNNRTNTHTLSANVLFYKGKGTALLHASQGNTSVVVDLEYHPGHIQTTSTVSFYDTQVASQVIMKRLSKDGNRDYHLKASLESVQLELDYIGELLFKTSENGFQAETEVKVDTRLHSRAMMIYLSEDLHHLAGIHLTLNEFVAEIGHEIDLSQPNRALITVGLEHRTNNVDRIFNVNMSTGADVLFHFGFTLESSDGNRFNSSLRLLESELSVGGRLDSPPGTYYDSARNL
ncbi:hypothetical protein Pcinc_028084, partial [Petrolisthes cinctipes]